MLKKVGTEDDMVSDDLPPVSPVDSDPEDQESESDGDEGDTYTAEDDDVNDIDPFSNDSGSDSD